MTKLAKGLSKLAEAFDADFEVNATSVSIFDVISALQSYDSYYINAAIDYPTLSMSTIVSMIDNGKPAYFRGENYNSATNTYEGHAWVIDGYLHVKETWAPGLTHIYYCLHHNWGCYGENDGYYTLDSYLASDMFSYDSTIDSSYINYSDTSNYINYRKFISY